MLSIKNLYVEVDGKGILKGLDLDIASGEIHAVMRTRATGMVNICRYADAAFSCCSDLI